MLVLIVLPSLALDASVSAETLEQRGRQLRAALEQKFRTLKEANQLGMGNGPGVDVSPIVAIYIPIGTSFEEAEKVLLAAKFKMGQRPPRPIYRESAPEWEKAMRFTLVGGFVLEQSFGYVASVGIELYPDSAGDPGAHVKEIQARIQTSYL
ncbi:MAG: hypothetical protein LZF60_230099 [Nitrospira sp.]|nr:hypothetical protein [Nitrospira sp.]ULA60363.1 MAG: hypothetical protein LZF60_230099 [Nitrospira sp.]